MKPTITDLVTSVPNANKKSIELLFCLQSSSGNIGTHCFIDRDYKPFLAAASEIKRLTILKSPNYVGKMDGLSVIEADGCLFLGRWNDGVVC